MTPTQKELAARMIKGPWLFAPEDMSVVLDAAMAERDALAAERDTLAIRIAALESAPTDVVV